LDGIVVGERFDDFRACTTVLGTDAAMVTPEVAFTSVAGSEPTDPVGNTV
jgi:hypothetical protein